MTNSTPVIKNRKAYFNYKVDEKLEVGIVLTGTEVKSVRQSKMNISEAYINIDDNLELFIQNCHIDEYTEGNRFNHNPRRKRKLLAHRTEILKMQKAISLKGYTLIPLKVYFNKGKVKIEIGTCKGKEGVDKRNTVKEREQKRSMQRALKSGNY